MREYKKGAPPKTGCQFPSSCRVAMAGRTSTPFVVAVEGNIGAGKSTLLSAIHALCLPDVDVVFEPLEAWRSQKFGNALQKTYENPAESTFTFQIVGLLTHAKQHIPPSRPFKVRFIERGLGTSFEIFAKVAHKRGHLTQVQLNILELGQEICTKGREEFKYDIVLYLQVTPAECLRRIRTRNRPEEQTITLEYLQQLHDAYEEWVKTLPEGGVFKFSSDVLNKDVTEQAKWAVTTFSHMAYSPNYKKRGDWGDSGGKVNKVKYF